MPASSAVVATTAIIPSSEVASSGTLGPPIVVGSRPGSAKRGEPPAVAGAALIAKVDGMNSRAPVPKFAALSDMSPLRPPSANSALSVSGRYNSAAGAGFVRSGGFLSARS